MSIRTSPWPAGVPCWSDLTTPDVQAAQAFYSAVLGWSFDQPAEEFGGYVIATAKGAAAAGIGPAKPDVPFVWTVYLASDDADKSAAAVTEHGGTVLFEPDDVGPLGRMFIAADPTGAVFGVWQAGVHIGSGIVNEPGGIVWEDLRSTDPDAARAFYAAVFGYSSEPMAEAGPDYHLFTNPGEQAPLGGMGGMMGAPDGTPSHWLVYFGVENAADAVHAAVQAGGTSLAPAFQTPYGTMAALADPAGAVFWIVEAVPGAPQPDRAG